MKTFSQFIMEADEYKSPFKMSVDKIKETLGTFNKKQRNALHKKHGGRNITALHHNPKTGHVQVHFDDVVAHDFYISHHGAISDSTIHKLQHNKD